MFRTNTATSSKLIYYSTNNNELTQSGGPLYLFERSINLHLGKL